jgi:hypothetical protein
VATALWGRGYRWAALGHPTTKVDGAGGGEVRYLVKGGSAPGCPAGLVGWYTLDELFYEKPVADATMPAAVMPAVPVAAARMVA